MLLSEPPGITAPVTVSWRRDLLVLTLGFLLLFGFRLGSYPLANPDEGRNAEIAREMVASGDYVTPRLNGVNYFEKPPLVYWLVAGALRLIGPNEWAVRAVPMIFGFAGVLLTYVAGRRLYGRAAGFCSAVVLGTSFLYLGLTRLLVLDMAVSVLMAAALVCFILGIREPAGARRRWLFYGLYASAALAALAKGLIGFLVPGAIMFSWLLIFNQWKRLRPFYLPSGLLLFLAIAAPWHVLAATHNERWFDRYIVYEHFQRFLSSVADKPGPWYYFIPVILLGLFPWTGFLWCSTRSAVAGGWAARKGNADSWFLVTWFGFVFLFFSVSQSKLPTYILPIFPPTALLIGRWLATLHRDKARELRPGLSVFSFLCGAMAIASGVAATRLDTLLNSSARAAEARPFAVTIAVVLMLGGILAPALGRSRGRPAAVAAMAATIAIVFAVLTMAIGIVQRPGTRELARLVATVAQPGDRVVHYHEFFHDFTFYSERLVDVVAFQGELQLAEDPAARASGRFMAEEDFRALWAKPQRVFAVARKRDIKELFGDSSFRYHLLGEMPAHYLFSNQP